jgi:Xaa-Pro aminopeptidase
MAQSGINALLVTSQQNYEYVTGQRSMAWIIKSRPLAVVFPQSGHPVGIVTASLEPCVRALGVLTDIQTYQGFETEAVRAIVDVLRRLRLADATIGIELGKEQRIGLPLGEVDALRRALERARFVDGAGVLWKARIKKSPPEIDYLRKSGNATGEAYRSILSSVRAGWTEREVYKHFAAGVINGGADRPGYITTTNGPGSYTCYTAWPSERPLVAGEIFWMDGGCVYDSYWSDYTRVMAVGNASPAQQKTYRTVVDVLDRVLVEVRPGVPAATLMTVAADACRRIGRPMRVASRVGHGIGLDLAEPPSLALDETVVLEAGMAITVEPGILTHDGWFHLEENLVVTEGGYELLSAPMPRELPILG